MTETGEEKAWGGGLKGAKSFDFAIYKSHLHTQESQVGTILCSVFLSCVVGGQEMEAAWGSAEHMSTRSLCWEHNSKYCLLARQPVEYGWVHASVLLEEQQGRRGGIQKQQSHSQNSRTLTAIPFPKATSMNLRDLLSPQLSPRDQNNEVHLSFDTQMRSPSSPSIPRFISLFSPSPSNILVTSSQRGTPSLAFFGWCNFTQGLASAGRVIKSCCSITMSTWSGLSTSGEETARTSAERLYRCVVLLWSQSPALRALACSCSTRTWGLLEANVTWTALNGNTDSSLKLSTASLGGSRLSRQERRDPGAPSYSQKSRTCRNIFRTAKDPKTKIWHQCGNKIINALGCGSVSRFHTHTQTAKDTQTRTNPALISHLKSHMHLLPWI